MRKVSLMLVAALLLSTGSIFANDSKKVAEPAKTQNLSEQIGNFLKSNDFDEKYEGHSAQVLFMLNDNKEIVVLSVETDKQNLEGFIKSRLNYKQVDLNNYEEGKKYTVSVRVAS
ncbi:MAG: hypothetical protein AB8B59_15845 [Maribacter sp.]